ncbi:MAG: ABC transporter ATP-binding protein [Bryobacteraceae bacterium]|jgi:ABC-type polysaccharide/polyol phosphate transport system ATPase subunit
MTLGSAASTGRATTPVPRTLESDLVLVQNVSKLYRLYRRPADRLRELLPGVAPAHRDFWALRDISFEVERGETLGLVGPNGCGKSTLLQMVSGILQPTTGRVVTRGRIAALLELGAGFNPEFSGRENVYLNGEIMGLSRAEIDRAMPSIESFAEIGEFMERPVKEYSSGMYVRLAFSTAIHVDPEILIVDEALAVGDAVFANRCVRKFQELRERKITVLFVSHDLGLVKQLSDRAILLLGGRIEAAGAPNDVINRYIGLVLEKQAPETRQERVRSSFRHGDGTSEIVGIQMLNARGEETTSIASGEPVTVRVQARFHRAVSDPMVGILVRTRIGMDVYGTNTRIEHTELGDFDAGQLLEVDFGIECWLTPQQYTLTAATQNADGSSHDWLDDAIAFDVVDTRVAAGVANLRAKIEWRASR